MNWNRGEKFRATLDAYMISFRQEVEKYATGKLVLSLPVPDTETLISLFECVQQLFKDEPSLMDVKSPCIVVGDIHGQILDLYRILRFFGMPNSQRYVFLGDIVDRGEFSIETLVVVYLLKALWPQNVFVIRGNHEFQDLCSQGEGNFLNQVITVFEDYSIYQAAAKSFEYIPLAVRIDKVMLCVHGGIGPRLRDLNSIRQISKPIESFGSDNLDSLVWSDPSEDVEMFEDSSRGTGYLFGALACEAFLKACGLTTIIRGHECVDGGFETHFDNKLITVFSASNYCGVVNNQSGVLEVTGPSTYKVRQFPPLPWLRRDQVMFMGGKRRTLDMGAFVRRKAHETPETTSNMPALCQKKPRVLKKGRIAASQTVTELPKLNIAGDVSGVKRIRLEPTGRVSTGQGRRRSLH